MTSAATDFFKDLNTSQGIESGISALRQSLEQIYAAREAVLDGDAVGLIKQINQLSSEVFPNLSNPDDRIKTLDVIANLAQAFSDRYGDFFPTSFLEEVNTYRLMVQAYRELEKALKKAKNFQQKTERTSGVKGFTNGLYELLEVIEVYKEYLPEQTLNTLVQISREIAEYFTQESKYTPKEFGRESFKSRSIIPQELNREIATLAKAMLWEISKEIEIEESKRRRFKPRKIDTFVLKFWDQKEQIKKNQPAIEFFRKRLQEKSSTPEDKEDFELLKQIIDENRERKLFE